MLQTRKMLFLKYIFSLKYGKQRASERGPPGHDCHGDSPLLHSDLLLHHTVLQGLSEEEIRKGTLVRVLEIITMFCSSYDDMLMLYI